jgi:dsDNA-specific endonuclease/ATPase MutS2
LTERERPRLSSSEEPSAREGSEFPARPASDEIPAVELEITDVLDLHSFPPREVATLVRDWLDLAYARGFRTLRIIHGRGKGVQRRTVQTLLARDARVARFEDAPTGAGGWGATVIEMR